MGESEPTFGISHTDLRWAFAAGLVGTVGGFVLLFMGVFIRSWRRDWRLNALSMAVFLFAELSTVLSGVMLSKGDSA